MKNFINFFLSRGASKVCAAMNLFHASEPECAGPRAQLRQKGQSPPSNPILVEGSRLPRPGTAAVREEREEKRSPHFLCRTLFAVRTLLITSLACCTFTASALDFQIGTSEVAQGTINATVPIQLANVPTNLSAFAFYVVNDPALGSPNITGQNNVAAFVDDFGSGIYRITAFTLGDPGFGNGTVFSMMYSLSAEVEIGSYPISFLSTPPLDAPLGSNPEARTLFDSALIPSTGTGGLVQVIEPIVSTVNGGNFQTDGTFRLQFSGNPAWNYLLEISTNLVNWTTQTNLMAGPNGLFEFIDADATNHPIRFYRLKVP